MLFQCLCGFELVCHFTQADDEPFFSLFNQSAGDFTLGRCYRIWYPLSDFKSYGFGSTSHVLGINLELDLVKIYMELGLLALALFVYVYMNICNQNLYLYVLMVTMFVNLLVASGLTSTFGWIMRMITVASILYANDGWKGRVKILKLNYGKFRANGK